MTAARQTGVKTRPWPDNITNPKTAALYRELLGARAEKNQTKDESRRRDLRRRMASLNKRLWKSHPPDEEAQRRIAAIEARAGQLLRADDFGKFIWPQSDSFMVFVVDLETAQNWARRA